MLFPCEYFVQRSHAYTGAETSYDFFLNIPTEAFRCFSLLPYLAPEDLMIIHINICYHLLYHRLIGEQFSIFWIAHTILITMFEMVIIILLKDQKRFNVFNLVFFQADCHTHHGSLLIAHLLETYYLLLKQYYV